MNNLHNIVNFLFEAGMLAKTPRSGFFFLGSGEQSVAEHINRMTLIGLVLAKMIPEADENKVMKMCLFHDVGEARTSDLNYIHQKYVNADEHKAWDDLAETLPFGPEVKELLTEWDTVDTLEARIARDADQLELLLSLKEQMDIGNSRAKSWIPITVQRLKNDEAKQLAEVILTTDSDKWWFGDKEDSWWVNRNGQYK